MDEKRVSAALAADLFAECLLLLLEGQWQKWKNARDILANAKADSQIPKNKLMNTPNQ